MSLKVDCDLNHTMKDNVEFFPPYLLSLSVDYYDRYSSFSGNYKFINIEL